MTNNKYIIKYLAPWMMDELIVFSKSTDYDIIFLKDQLEFYNDDLDLLKKNGIKIYTMPVSKNNFLRKFIIITKFIFFNLTKFGVDYNWVLGFKSILWFLKLDLSLFSSESKMHVQFATQPAIIALLIKQYFANKPEYSFTFHAHDIYFKNRWFNVLVNNCYKAFSISNYNINYVNKKYLISDNIVLSRLGVFRNSISETKINDKEAKNDFVLGLMTWFDEKKGMNYLLEAMLVLKQKGYKHIKLKLAGDGSLKDEYLEFIDRNNLADTVSYIGKVKREDKKDFFNSIDAFVLPSISLKNDQDGIPVVLMEAIAYSLPIISTNVSGIPEICINDFNGSLISERNVDELVNAILYFMNNEVKRKEFAKNSFELSKEYDIILNSNVKLESLGWS